MRVFQSTYRDRSGQRRKTAKWYVEFRDHREIRRRLPGLTGRRPTEALGRRIETLVALKVSAQALPPDMTRWLEGLPPRLTANLARIGLLDAGKVAALRPLVEHLEGAPDAPGWRQHLAAKGNTPDHVEKSVARAKRIIEGCRFAFWSDLSASKVLAFLDGLRADAADDQGNVRPGISAQTFNYYLGAFKSFCRWMVKDGRATESPVAHLDGLNARTDRRHDRRALSVDEIRRLLEATRNGPTRRGMSGSERALLYRLALETGLRRGELASLTRASFDLDADPRTVTVLAAYSKRRRQDALPLRPDTAAVLRDFLASKTPGARAFNMPRSRHDSAGMFRADLEAAGLPYVDAAGRYADFHALRHTAGSLLAAAGVHPKVAQSIMRHCTIDLTMSRYTHVFAGQEADAVASLPDFGAGGCDAARATGTDTANAPQDAPGLRRTDDLPPSRPSGPSAQRERRSTGGAKARFALGLLLGASGRIPADFNGLGRTRENGGWRCRKP